MIFKRARRLAITTSALAAFMTSGVPAAFAQDTLMELFFGNRPARQQQAEPAPQQVQPQRQTPPPSLPRVRGPQYYDYRVDALVRVDFGAIARAVAALEDAADRPELDEGTVGTVPDVAVDRRLLLAAAQAAARAPAPERPAARSLPAPALLTGDMLTGLESYEMRAEEEVAKAITAFYSQNPQTLWIADGALTDMARDALSGLADAGSHGLNPDDYALARPGPRASQADLVRFEMALSARVLRYVRDASSGRVDPNRISGYHDFEREEIDMAGKLGELAGGADMAAFLEAQHPRNAYYTVLKAELAELRASSENEIVVAPDTLIRPGETNEEFAKILELVKRDADDAFMSEFGGLLADRMDTTRYSQDLVPVIRAAQRAAGVGVDGVIGPRTVMAIAGDSRAARIEKVKVAMEQLRWLPSDLGERYVFLNAPSFDARYVEGGEERLSMRAIYGNISTQTYFFQDEISYVEFHPFWGVPRSIIVNTYLPRLYRDPTYLDRNGFEVTDRNGRRVSSAQVDWASYGANPPFNVLQRPGPSNALGELKIMFPNRHAIYMHDTPDRHLFSNENRAISNGCIRLENPRGMAAAVLGWDGQDVNRRLDGPHSRENLSEKVPVYVAYFTAWPDSAGAVQYHTDVYDRDRRTMAAIERIENLRTPSG